MNHLTVVHVSLLIGVLFTALLIGHILRQRRAPAATLAWVIFMLALPWLAVPLYLAIGTRKFGLREMLTVHRVESNSDPLECLLVSAGVPPDRGGNCVEWHADGDAAWSALRDLIASAAQSLDIMLFLLRDDARGNAFIQQLCERARAGVPVRLLLDGIGALLLSRRAVRRLRAAGVSVVWFIPLLHRPFRGRSNLRNHRKLALADGQRAWSGGRNVAAEYFAADVVWTDLSYTLAGPVASDLQALFNSDWAFACRQPLQAPPPVSAPAGDSRVQIVPSGPRLSRDTLAETLLTACYGASRRIHAVTPYFVPDDALQQALCLAARRGVAVRLILPQRSNHRLADIARARYLRELAIAGVCVRLVPDAMVHAKALLIDDLALAGSANLDLRSLFLNFELMCLFRSPADADALAQWLARLDARAQDYALQRAPAWRELVEGLVLLTAFQI